MKTCTYTILVTIADHNPPSAEMIAQEVKRLYEDRLAYADCLADGFVGDLVCTAFTTSAADERHAAQRKHIHRNLRG